MPDPNFINLYVNDATISAAFYAGLFGKPPIQASPGYAMFPLASGLTVGLWTLQGTQPASTVTGGGAELVFPVEDTAAVHATHAAWTARGLTVIQPPTEMGFGTTFLAVDPDGHRLRVFAPLVS